MAAQIVPDSQTQDDRETGAEILDLFNEAYAQCEVACAIIDAAAVLCALDRAPAHHDTHPSHNIITGAGYASGRRVASDTLPKILKHARTLVDMSMNDFDVMREKMGVSHG